MKCNLKNKCQYVQTFGTCIAEEGRICECFERQPTKADRIRSMSDEELAGLIRVIYMSEECPLCKLECKTCFFKEVCAGTYFGKEIEWLKQPAE